MNEVDDNGNEINGEYDNSKVKIIFLLTYFIYVYYKHQ